MSAPAASRAFKLKSLSLSVTLDPAEGTLEVSATATLSPSPPPSLDVAPSGVISFFLHRDLEITAVEVDGVPARFAPGSEVDRALFAPAAHRVAVAAPAEIGDSVRLALRYRGRIASGPRSNSRITPELTELNLYAAWFPLFEGPQGFEYELDVSAPPGMTVVGNGDAIQTAAPPDPAEPTKKHVILRGRSAAGDLPVIVSPLLRSLAVPEGRRCHLEIVAADLPAGIASWIASETAAACEVLAAGRGDREVAFLRIAIVPREGDGYARPPLVVIPASWVTEAGPEGPRTDPEKDELLRRLFHEMAHVLAPLADTHTYDDWINEGLAEFLGREALVARRGKAALAPYLRGDLLELAARSKTPPVAPISATRRSDPDAHLLYYVKGAMIFRMISGIIGPDAFNAALEEMRAQFSAGSDRRMTTGDLIRSLGRSASISFDWLREEWIEGSGLPEIAARFTLAPQTSDHFTLATGTGGYEMRHGGGASLVTGEVMQEGPRPFHLAVPIEARRGELRASTMVRLTEKPARVEWRVPFRPSEVVLDPELIVPRVDEKVREALRLVEIDLRAASLTREGLEAEKSGNFKAAIAKYDAAVAADPSSILPRFRRARVYAALKRYDAALAAHRETLDAAERSERESARLASRLGPDSGAAEAPARLWLRAELDLRSWNQVRMGQVEDVIGRRSAAKRAYRRALELPDLRGAHDEARRFLAAPYTAAGPLPPASP